MDIEHWQEAMYGNIPINHYIKRTTFFLSYYIKRQYHWISFILRTTLSMGGSYQYHTCLREFSRSDSLRRHLESDICKQNERSEDDSSDDSESHLDDNSTNKKDEIPKSQSEFDPWNKLIKQTYYSYKTHSTRCNIRRDLWNLLRILRWKLQKQKERHLMNWNQIISSYHDLVQMGNILKKTQSTNKWWLQLNNYDPKKITI